jgi:pimeloyl-ACP methyl ester carboxylesterase
MSEYLGSLADELDGLVTTARYQQRGLAPSLTPGPKDVETHVADAIAVMNALGWERPLVIGHSWGGHLAMHLAVRHPERISALVILDPLGAVGDGGESVFGKRLRASLGKRDLARLKEIEAIDAPTEAQVREHLGLLWPRYFGDPASAPPMPQLHFDLTTDETWTSIHSHLEGGTLQRGLPGVSVPTLLIHGDLSPVPLVEAEKTVALMPRATLIVHRGKGHWAWLEEPGFVRAQVELFLASADEA